MKERYQNAKMVILEFAVDDVIATSDPFISTMPSTYDYQRPDYGGFGEDD